MRQQIIINIDVNPTEPIEIPDLHALHAGFEKSEIDRGYLNG